MTLGTVTITDPRLDVDRRFDIAAIEFRDGALQLRAEGRIRIGGTIEDGDIVTIHGPDRKMVTRYWLTMDIRQTFHEGHRFEIMLPISLGGRGGMAFADSTLDVDL